MSGVIDENGQQWERCNRCAGFTKFEDLQYEERSEQFEYGRDICPSCYMDMLIGGPKTLPKEKWKDQIDPDRAKELRAQIHQQIAEHGMQVTTYHADGTITDDSIPPREKQS